jgi:hypothetical protein
MEFTDQNSFFLVHFSFPLLTYMNFFRRLYNNILALSVAA